MRRISLILVGLALLSVRPAHAHHAFAAEFSTTSRVTVKGTVVQLNWLNPHARFELTAKDSHGAILHWEFLLGSPNLLIKMGWERGFLKPGQVVSVNGFQARDGSRLVSVRSILLPDGRLANFGSAVDGGPE